MKQTWKYKISTQLSTSYMLLSSRKIVGIITLDRRMLYSGKLLLLLFFNLPITWEQKKMEDNPQCLIITAG